MASDNRPTHRVFQVRDRGEDKKAVWTELGIGFANKDGSINLVLNAFPITGKLQVRTYEVKEASK